MPVLVTLCVHLLPHLHSPGLRHFKFSGLVPLGGCSIPSSPFPPLCASLDVAAVPSPCPAADGGGNIPHCQRSAPSQEPSGTPSEGGNFIPKGNSMPSLPAELPEVRPGQVSALNSAWVTLLGFAVNGPHTDPGQGGRAGNAPAGMNSPCPDPSEDSRCQGQPGQMALSLSCSQPPSPGTRALAQKSSQEMFSPRLFSNSCSQGEGADRLHRVWI